MSLLTVVHGRGTTAAKPAAAAANEGYIYFDTTLGKLQRSNGATWDDISETTAGAGSITASGYTQTTARMLGRTTAATGAIEEITVGSGLSLAAGALTATAAEFPTGTAEVATSQTTTSATFVDLTTAGPSVTVTIGATGKAKVTLSCRLKNTAANDCYVGIVVSGANTVAAATYMLQNGTAESEFSRVHVFSGLATGSTTFKMQYAVAAGTGTFAQRELIVEPVL